MAASSGRIKIRGQVTAYYFYGDPPFTDEQVEHLPGYVGRAWCDVYASDLAEALQAASEALGDYEVDE